MINYGEHMKTEDIIKELEKYPGLNWEVAASFDDEPFTGLVSGYTGEICNAQIQIDIPKVNNKKT